MIIGRHFLHIIGMSDHIDGVARRENRFGRNGLLRDRTEDGTVFAAHLQHRHAVAVSQIEFLHGAALDGRWPVGGLQAEDTVVDMIFMEQSGKRFAIIGLSAVAALFAEEDAAERPKEQCAHDEENKSDGREIEESEVGLAVFREVIAHNEVGRRTNQGEHTTERTGKSQGHHQFRRTHPACLTHGQNDGQKERHGSCVAHKGSHNGRHEHHKEKQPFLIGSCQSQQASADNLGQTGLKHGTSNHKKPNHHHHGGIRETGQSGLGIDHTRGEEHGG